VVVLIWVYYTSQIIPMGAEVTHSFGATFKDCPTGDGGHAELPHPTTSGERNKGHRRVPEAKRLPAVQSNCFSLRASIGAALF
jgi:uncharacterized BrkB/YihY/UPF0761 family membrane protein